MNPEFNISELINGIERQSRRDEHARVEVARELIRWIPQHATQLQMMRYQSDVQTVIRELDEQCEYNNTFVRVSGRARVAFYDEIANANKIEERELRGDTLMSRGFHALTRDGVEMEIGQLFVIPNSQRLVRQISSREESLVTQYEQYYAYAPYGTVDIEHEMSNDDRLEYLQNMIPDDMEDVDQLLMNSAGEVDAIRALGSVSLDSVRISKEVAAHLLAYVQRAIDLHKIPLQQCVLRGMYLLEMTDTNGDGAYLPLPYDVDIDDGGEAAVVSRIRAISLQQTTHRANGATEVSDALHYGLELEICAASSGHERLVGRSIDVAIKDIVHMESVRPSL